MYPGIRGIVVVLPRVVMCHKHSPRPEVLTHNRYIKINETLFHRMLAKEARLPTSTMKKGAAKPNLSVMWASRCGKPNIWDGVTRRFFLRVRQR